MYLKYSTQRSRANKIAFIGIVPSGDHAELGPAILPRLFKGLLITGNIPEITKILRSFKAFVRIFNMKLILASEVETPLYPYHFRSSLSFQYFYLKNFDDFGDLQLEPVLPFYERILPKKKLLSLTLNPVEHIANLLEMINKNKVVGLSKK
ncbi:hypothetical protein V1478_011927 [Vespula squamosa]|uniref:Uncharacterized protein n=1 Tax=Vespula squamosa TaxID=30214 RepID=A0ABD2ABT7_VESSQ